MLLIAIRKTLKKKSLKRKSLLIICCYRIIFLMSISKFLYNHLYKEKANYKVSTKGDLLSASQQRLFFLERSFFVLFIFGK